jgi:ArsR family transcriptional regulator, lead/cadmium/zinc/bismuth-responsive transcriptional repressor
MRSLHDELNAFQKNHTVICKKRKRRRFAADDYVPVGIDDFHLVYYMFVCSYIHMFQEDKMETKSVGKIPYGKARETADCSAFVVHSDRVEAARAAAIDPKLLTELEDLFKVFSDATRLRILGALASGELCVCDIGAVLGMSQSAVSHQLAVLRAARMVAFRREGKTVYYRLADDHVALLHELGRGHASARV